MADVTIFIKAKNAASATFDRVKADVKGMSDASAKATSAMKAGQEALAKVMRGDLLGAAQSAASGFKALWAVIVSNPIAAAIAIVAAFAVGLYKLYSAHKEAQKAAIEHQGTIISLRNSLKDIVEGTTMDKLAKEIKKLEDSLDDKEIKRRIENIKAYIATLANIADMKLIEMEQLSDEKEIEKAKKEYDKLVETLKTARDAQKAYEGALDNVAAAHAKTAEAEAKASKQAIENARAKIAAEREFQQEIDATFDKYESQQAERERLALADEAAGKKAVARAIELIGAKDSLAKAEIERRHIAEDIAEMEAAGVAVTKEYNALIGKLAIKEAEIQRIKDDAAAAAAEEAADRLKGAKDLLAVEQEIAKLKRPDAKLKRPDVWDEKGWRGKDPKKQVIDPWDALRKKQDPWDALRQTPGMPVVPPVVPTPAPGAPPANEPEKVFHLVQKPGDVWAVKDAELKNALVGGGA